MAKLLPRRKGTSRPLAMARHDLILLLLATTIVLSITHCFSVFERLFNWSYRWRLIDLSEVIGSGFIACFALTLFAWRRWCELRQIAADLCAREAHLRFLTEQLPAFVWTTNADLRLTSFLGSAFRRADIETHGRVGLTVAEFFNTRDLAYPPLAAHHCALAGKPASYTLHRDDQTYEIQVEPLYNADGKIVGCLGLGIDVTAREQAATALRDSEARFRAIFEGAAIGIGLADLERRPLMVNPALARITGQTHFPPRRLPRGCSPRPGTLR
jgi:PAS domain-containing protein